MTTDRVFPHQQQQGLYSRIFPIREISETRILRMKEGGTSTTADASSNSISAVAHNKKDDDDYLSGEYVYVLVGFTCSTLAIHLFFNHRLGNFVGL
jgi:hypothetical protein